MKHKAIMAIALLALVSLVITPVMAYTTLWTINTPNTTGAAHVITGEASPAIRCLDIVNFSGVSYISVTGDMKKMNDWGDPPPLGAYTDTIQLRTLGMGGGDLIGNATYHSPAIAAYGVYEEATFELFIDDFDLGALSGVDEIYLWGLRNYTIASLSMKVDATFNAPEGKCGFRNFMTANSPTGVETWYGGYPVPEASFTCVPTSQYPNEDIVCTDTSTNDPSVWLWTLDLEEYDIDGWRTYDGQDYTWQSAYPGIYSVNLWAANAEDQGSWYNRTNYVSISVNATPNDCSLPVATGYIRSMAQCVDTQTSAAIHGCNLQLNDIEGGAWSNVCLLYTSPSPRD